MLALVFSIVYRYVVSSYGLPQWGRILLVVGMGILFASAILWAKTYYQRRPVLLVGLLGIELVFVTLVIVDIFTIWNFGHNFTFGFLGFFADPVFLGTITPTHRAGVLLVMCLYIFYAGWVFITPRRSPHRFLIITGLIAMVTVFGGRISIYSRVGQSGLVDQEDQMSSSTNELMQTTLAGQGHDGNLIILFAESFSLIDSKLGGVYDRLPAFDQIAADGLAYREFMSNGCTSDAAHVATLFGGRPWAGGVGSGSQYAYLSSDYEGLGTFFEALDYETYFISTVSLDFQDQLGLIQQAGYETIIGSESFDDQQQYTFQSAPDEALYDEILTTIDSQTDPYFITAQTISTHLPYDTPYGSTEDEVRQYANDTLLAFYEGLQSRDYFDDGTLVIVSDHRKFDPLEPIERELRGQSAHGRVVATLVGDIAPRGITDMPTQHIDLYHMLRHQYASGAVTVRDQTNTSLVATPQLPGRDWTVRYCPFVDDQFHVTTSSQQYYVTQRLGDAVSQFVRQEQVLRSRRGRTTTHASNQSGVIDAMESLSIDTAPILADEFPVQLVGHRGGAIAGQNTMQGIREVARLGVDAIEIDMAMTKDENVFLTNGHTNNMSCQLGGKIAFLPTDFVLQNCQTLNNEPLQGVVETLSKMAGLFETIFLELKIENGQNALTFVDQVVDAIRLTDTHRQVVVISYDETARRYAATFDDIQVGRDNFTADDAYLLDDTGYTHFLTEKSGYTTDHVRHIQQLGKTFVTYTLTSESDLQQAIDSGVDMILVDHLPRFQDWLE